MKTSFTVSCAVIVVSLLTASFLTGSIAYAAGAIVVTNAGDSGGGSLRQAILSANSTSAGDVISFSVGSGPITISPTSPLPAVTRPVTIDATSQPGYNGTPIVVVRGTNAGRGSR